MESIKVVDSASTNDAMCMVRVTLARAQPHSRPVILTASLARLFTG